MEAWNTGSQVLDNVQLRIREGANPPLVGRGVTLLLRLAVNQRLTVMLKAMVMAMPGQVLTAQVEATGMRLDMEARASYQALVRQAQAEAWYPAAGADQWQAAVGHLEVALPAHRDERIASIAVRGLYGRGERRDPTHLYEFEIEARDTQGRVIEQFEQPVVLRWRY